MPAGARSPVIRYVPMYAGRDVYQSHGPDLVTGGWRSTGRELTLLGKWAIFFSNYLLVTYCGLSTERVGECVDIAV